jgi:hypothetical protein
MLKEIFNQQKENLNKYLRKKAIQNLEDRLYKRNLKLTDFSKEELETMIAEEEKEIKHNLKTKILTSALAITIGVDIL